MRSISNLAARTTKLGSSPEVMQVVDLVRKGMPLSQALRVVLDGIRDSSRPKTSDVADEAIRILRG